MHGLIHLADALIQAALTFPDTIVTKQVTAEPGIFQKIMTIASGLTTVALLVLAVGLVPAAWNFRKTYRKINHLIDQVYGDVAPLVRSVSVVTEDVREVVALVKGETRLVQQTVESANARLLKAVRQAEERIDQFNALLEVVQEEAESAFVSTAATVHGVRTGLGQVFENTTGEEDGDDSDGSATNAGSARPRVRPRRNFGGLA